MNPKSSVQLFAALFGALLVPASPAQTGLIDTIAGTGVAGTAGVGGPAVNAQLGGGVGVAVDRFDNLFLADYSKNRVLRVDAASGILTVIAGTGEGVSSGDYGPATQASVYRPYGVAVDAAGNLLIAESGGNRIRRIDAQTGIITTVVGSGIQGFSGDGGPAVAASLNYPISIALDSAGNMYIADSGNLRVRRVDAQTGIITTIAGNGVYAFTPDGSDARYSSLAGPVGVSVDHSGNVLLSEPNSGRIRRVSSATGILETVAGNGTSAFNGDAIPATTAGIGASVAGIGINVASDAGGNLYFADGTGRVRRIDAATGLIGTVAGSGKTSNRASGGCYAGPLGDSGPAAIAVVDAGFSIALTANGNLVFSDWIDCRVRRVYLPSPYPYTKTAVSVTPTPVGFSRPLTFTATVTPIGASGTPTGTVEFVVQVPNYAPVSLGVAQLVNGTASLTITSPSGPGNYQIIGYYSGDSSFNGSGSPAAELTVADIQKALPTVTLSSSQNPVNLDTPVSFSARVAAPAGNTNQPTATIYFFDGSIQVGMAPLVAGVAQVSVSFADPGPHTMVAMYEGDDNFLAANSPGYIQTVNRIATTIALTSGYPPSPVYGGPVELTATITPPNITGTINLTDGAGFWGVGNPNYGVLQLYPNLSAGSHAIVASYSGDGLFAPSTSAPLTVNVAKATPIVTLASAANPSMQGQDLTLTATVSPVSDGAIVQFLDGATVIGSAVLHTGTVTFNAWLGAGRHSLTAVCVGDKNLLPASSPALDQAVQATTVLAVQATPGALTWGQSVTFTATLGNPSVTGTIQFADGATSLGTFPLSAGLASLTLSTLSVGAHQITASYSGDGIYLPSTGSISVTIGKATPAIALTSAPNPAAGRSLVLTSNLTPGSASGTVQFLDGATVLGTVTLTGGTASLSTPILSPGSHSFTAVYSGDGNFNGVTSAPVTQTIKAETSISLSSSPNPSVSGQVVALTASVSPGAATGAVQFLDGATLIGTGSIANGTASITTTSLASGSHSITAVYSGDSAYTGSASLAVVQVVKQSTTTTIGADTTTPVFGQTVRLTATVAPGGATGSVQFLDGATPLATVAVSGGTAALSIATFSTGSHNITAAYSGDSSNAASASTILVVTVSRIPAAVSLASSVNPSVSGQSVTFLATVTPAAATGTVQFLDGATLLGGATVSAGAAALSVSTLAVGTHSITAVYSGDAGATSAASAAIAQVVKPVAPSNFAVTNTTAGTINLTFTPSPTPGVTSYRIYGSSTPGVTTQSMLYAIVYGSPVSLTDFTSGTTTYFVITAWSPNGESLPSNEVVATTKGKAH